MSSEVYQEVHRIYPVRPDINRLANLCTFDLVWGPVGPTDDNGKRWPGFSASTGIIADWFDRNVPSTLYVSDWGDVTDTEPEPFEDDETGELIEPCYEDWTRLEAKDIKTILFGKYLADYVS
jgi:hypothetical protein